MKTPEKNPKKQGSSDTHGSKTSSTTDKTKHTNSGKNPWKNPDPTNPKKSPEKVNEPYARTNAEVSGATKTAKPKPEIGTKQEKITNAGESEHHIPVNKSDYETFEDEYEDFELEEEDDEFEEEEDEDGETSSDYNYEEEEDESRQFRSKVVPVIQKKTNEQNKLHQKQPNKAIENKNKSQLPSNFNQKKNNNPQG